ncbi:undecaprenyl/decaprenyl-phosphate alpha-N-acetylglucosaminyl 1-phosphate transferase [Alkaliphilus pronyensis]|uniref:Undecaprenyl/decaprenyl-phosphate alpha-N-acetylglucosaminyl 1-phosphate transferase n=1 Tax=Alkaliphilus pronyensis TaxID=1482732 RepID=A0A6I0FBS5_9FIRM|nr:MraY family glycosyltransferase [Alkaliphilus pronyensis]KAB3539715.1 undecaprenyl/decaprenyl-phosphate alpha-N-acetylglucosaminyl 1-phosphate transferase [Alkaliphilus pronyensis]
MVNLFMAFFFALMISYILTPYAKKLAYKIGAVDVPKDNRRVHTHPIPRMGGLAIFLAFAITALITVPIDKSFKGILIGATMITAIGIIDDVKQISAKYKLIVQLLAAAVVMYCGIKIEYIHVPILGEWLQFGKYSYIVTIIWIIGITNAVNLIDGLDGLAAGVSIIAAVTLGYIAFTHGRQEVAILLFILAGGSAGFLPYNFNPAKIFMGDTGALLIGFLLATISIEGVIKSATTIAVAIPVLALGVPVFDTAFAIVRRLINKRPIMEADKGHLHHRLIEYGLSQKQTVLVLYFISMVLGGSAVFISDTSSNTAYLVIVSIGLIVLLGALRVGLMEKSSRKANG